MAAKLAYFSMPGALEMLIIAAIVILWVLPLSTLGVRESLSSHAGGTMARLVTIDPVLCTP